MVLTNMPKLSSVLHLLRTKVRYGLLWAYMAFPSFDELGIVSRLERDYGNTDKSLTNVLRKCRDIQSLQPRIDAYARRIKEIENVFDPAAGLPTTKESLIYIMSQPPLETMLETLMLDPTLPPAKRKLLVERKRIKDESLCLLKEYNVATQLCNGLFNVVVQRLGKEWHSSSRQLSRWPLVNDWRVANDYYFKLALVLSMIGKNYDPDQ